jgi:hypothetical protein
LLVAYETDLPAQLRQAQVGVVLAQRQPELGARGQQPVRIRHALVHQVVDHHTDVGVGACQEERVPALHEQSRVRAGHQPLGRRLLVP